MPSLFIGLMSGTSLDGVDAVLASIDENEIRSLGAHHIPMPVELREDLLRLQQSGPDELSLSCLAANDIAKLYAQAVQSLLTDSGVSSAEILLLGAHGQTVRHQPAKGFTVQLLNAALLAELTGIGVAYDFRSRDIAAGGQGAPLVPAFHAHLFRKPSCKRVIVNIGGIANISVLDGVADQDVIGFDCGPGNVLMDGWCDRHQGKRYDANGDWASQGQCHEELLARLLSHPYFRLPYPKSTGRDDFHLDWLDHTLAELSQTPDAVDVQATLCELTAQSLAQACLDTGAQEVYLCGGGAYNSCLVKAIRRRLGKAIKLDTTAALGVPVDQVEALAFAWLAQRCLHKAPGNLPSVTGARGLRVLGAITR